MCASGGKKTAIFGKHITFVPSLSMNVLQKLLKDSCPEYITGITDVSKRLRDEKNQN